MIDRKTLWITLTLATIMLAAAAWRIALLPDWMEFPAGNGRTLHHSRFALFLFMPPLWMLAFLVIVAIKRRMRSGAREDFRPWAKWHGVQFIAFGVLVTAMQFFLIARSLGIADTLNPLAMVRTSVVATGILMIVTGNRLPKLPWLASRLKILELPPAQGAEFLRFCGWVQVGMGIIFVLGGAFLPYKLMMSVMLGVTVSVLIIAPLRRVQLKRERRGL
jgi:hypothetical protein